MGLSKRPMQSLYKYLLDASMIGMQISLGKPVDEVRFWLGEGIRKLICSSPPV